MEARVKERRAAGLREVHGLLKDLLEPRAAIYWPDLLLSTAVGWTAFCLAVAGSSLAIRSVALVVAVLALYRAVLFVHELSHLRAGALPGFRAVWNLMVGMPLLLPDFTYVGVHTDHHRQTLYGTPDDPEYLPLGLGPRWRILAFVLETPLIPIAFLLRFIALAPIGLVVPPFHHWLERHASSLAINLGYVRRDVPLALRRTMRIIEALVLVLWGTALGLAAGGLLPWETFVVWYLVSFGIALVNQIRTLAAHRYRNREVAMDVEGQLLDSVNVPGGPWTELWAPVGLRYHAMHHYLPSLPYHALGRAHRRLMSELPAQAPYRRTVEAGLLTALRRLWRDAGPA